MKDNKEKLRLLFLPYLYCFLGVLFLCTMIHWIFVIELDWITLNDAYINFLLPVLAALVVVFLFLRKKFKLLNYKDENGSTGFFILALFGIIVPTMIAQHYLETATGKLTLAATTNEIKKLPETKYYQLKNYFFHKNGVSIHQKVQLIGKNKTQLQFNIYAITPVYTKASDTLTKKCEFWLCHKYDIAISNKLSEAAKNRKFMEFHLDTERTYRNDSFKFTFLEALKYQKNVAYFKRALGRNRYNSFSGEDVFLSIHTEKFEDRNGTKLIWFFVTSLISLLGFALLSVYHKLKTASELKRDKEKAERERAIPWREKYSWLLPQKNFLITPIIVYINVLLFLALVVVGAGFISFDYSFLHDWGGVLRYEVKNGALWRLLTAQFLHTGILHLMNNMFSLYFIGHFLEPLLGKMRYLLIYLVCGIMASITSIFWHTNTLSVGASGAIFGLYGLILLLAVFKIFKPNENGFILLFAGIFIVYNLIMGLNGAIDNAAHIGGLLAGLFIGALLLPKIEEKQKQLKRRRK